MGVSLGACIGPGEARALVDLARAQARAFTYSALDALANDAAAALVGEGLRRGERVGLLGRNSAEYLAALTGILRAGAVAVPINYRFPDETIAFVCRDAGLERVFADEDQRHRLPSPVVRSALEPGAWPAATGTINADTDAGEIALVLYTSGSTGRPKGVLLSHGSQRSMIDAMAPRLAGLTGMVAAPLYHMNGLLFAFSLLRGGGSVVLAPRFEARQYLQAVHDYRVNLVSGVPTMLALMARERDLVERLDLGCVQSVQVGSAPLSETVVAETRALFPNARIANGYGTTEAGAGMFGSHPDGKPVPVMSIGYPGQHVEVRLVGPGAPDEGVLQVRTPAAMSGYLNLPEKTAEKMSGDGWIDTGDVMRRDSDGFYYFVGRDDDMFVCNGENVFPGQIERLLEGDPRIAEACVVPRDDPVRGQVPVAFVVPAQDADLDADTVKEIALEGAPAYMHPREVYFVERMPLAGTNKIDRRELARRAAGAHE